MTTIEFEPDTNETRKLYQELARHQFQQRLLYDIRVDLEICDIEGWSKAEYINMLWDTLNHFKETIEGVNDDE